MLASRIWQAKRDAGESEELDEARQCQFSGPDASPDCVVCFDHKDEWPPPGHSARSQPRWRRRLASSGFNLSQKSARFAENDQAPHEGVGKDMRCLNPWSLLHEDGHKEAVKVGFCLDGLPTVALISCRICSPQRDCMGPVPRHCESRTVWAIARDQSRCHALPVNLNRRNKSL